LSNLTARLKPENDEALRGLKALLPAAFCKRATRVEQAFRPAVWLLKKLALAPEVLDRVGKKDEPSCKDILRAFLPAIF